MIGRGGLSSSGLHAYVLYLCEWRGIAVLIDALEGNGGSAGRTIVLLDTGVM